MNHRLSATRVAALALLLATVFWGFGFTWAKAGGAAINHAVGLQDGAPIGPVLLLGIRFSLAGIVWIALFPAARQGWSLKGMVRGLFLGFVLGAGLIVQHLGLDRTSETVSAFLTSLTVLFVPLMMALGLRRPPRATVWIGVALATVGIWLMTGATPAGFGLGEFMGLACAIVFSLYIIAVNQVLPHESPWRMTAAQFLTTAVMCFGTCLLLGGAGRRAMLHVGTLALAPGVPINAALLSVFPTLLAFGILTHFQPRIDPSRAAIIYLMEPVFAALYALGHRPLTAAVLGGAALILVANALVEVLEARSRAAVA